MSAWADDDGARFDDVDTAAEVEAAFRTQRRIAVRYFVVFVVVALGAPAATVFVDGWSERRVIGGMSPAFVTAAFVLYLLFFLIVVAATTLANSSEDQMLGRRAGRTGRRSRRRRRGLP